MQSAVRPHQSSSPLSVPTGEANPPVAGANRPADIKEAALPTPANATGPRAPAAVDAQEGPRTPRPQAAPPSLITQRSAGGLAQLHQVLGDLQPAPIPKTPTVQLREVHHGRMVADPYRWLEQPFRQDQAVLPHQERAIQEWINAQNARTTQFLSQHKKLNAYLQERYYALEDRPRQQRPYTIPNLGRVQWRRANAAEPWTLYLNRQSETKTTVPTAPKEQVALPFELSKPEQVQGEMLLDERSLAQALNLAPNSYVSDLRASPDGRYLALAIGEYYGDDRRKVAIFDTNRKKPVGELITHVKWSQLMWLDEKRLIYAKVNMSEDELRKNAPDIDHRQMLHTVGSSPQDDVDLFPNDREPWVHTFLWREGNRLYRQKSYVGTYRTVVESAHFDPKAIAAGRAEFFPLYDTTGIEDTIGTIPNTSRLLLQTTLQEDGTHSTGRLAYIDTHDPERKLVTLVAPVPGREIEQALLTDNFLVVDFQIDLGHRLGVYDHSGTLLREIDFREFDLPFGTVHAMRYDREAQKLMVSFSSPLTPPVEIPVDLKTGQVEAPAPSTLPFDPSKFTVETTTYRSKDGTEIPMQIIHAKEGYDRNGTNPTILYGYGGFEVDVADRQFVRSAMIPFLEAGGTLALPALRGGAELGDAWHEAGMRHNKQNVFDDFIAAAEALREQGYTQQKVAIQAASNGGLLVGAVLLQRPDLFQAALPHAGVMDMLRYPEFSSGRWWVREYGDPKDPDDFATMMAYSPVHNVAPAEYPPVLVTTGLFDSRVDPSHSLKFLAALQAQQKGSAPILGFVNPDSGHWPDKHPKRMSEFVALQMTFLMSQLGMSAPKAQDAPRPGQDDPEGSQPTQAVA